MRNRRGTIELFGVLLPLLAATTCATCPPPRPQPDGERQVEVPFDSFRLDLPATAGVAPVDQRFTFFGGAQTTRMSFSLSAEGVGPGATLELVSPGAAGQAVPLSPGTILTPEVEGNVVSLRVRVPAGEKPPVLRVLRLLTTRREVPFIPAVAPLSRRVTAFPLTPGQAVDFAFARQHTHEDAPAETFFFSVSGLAGRGFDVLLFGGAEVRMGDPQLHGFPILSGSDVLERLPGTRVDHVLPGLQWVRFPGGREELLLAVTNGHSVQPNGVRDPLHMRLLVLPVSAPARLAFPSPAPQHFIPFPTGADNDGSKEDGMQNIGRCTNWQGVSPEVRLTSGGLTLTTPAGTVQLPGGDVGAPIPPVCYNGHEGTDFALLGHFAGQAAGVPVTAAAPGFVLDVADGNADTCFANPLNGFQVTCPTPAILANLVTVRQDDGLIASYFHLRRGSVLVAPGDRVECGQQLGQVGSSGDSTGPHLHFELQRLPGSVDAGTDASLGAMRNLGAFVDPYGAGLWRTSVGNTLPSPLCQ